MEEFYDLPVILLGGVCHSCFFFEEFLINGS